MGGPKTAKTRKIVFPENSFRGKSTYSDNKQETPDSERGKVLDDKEDLIRLRLPADPFSQQVIRLAVYMIGSRMEFNLAQLEDLRIAVDEASSFTLSHTPGDGKIQVEIGPGEEYLEIILISIPSTDCQGHLAMPASLSRLIMESVVDAVDIKNEEDLCRISLRKKSPFQEVSTI